jgi:hypothetical protein
MGTTQTTRIVWGVGCGMWGLWFVVCGLCRKRSLITKSQITNPKSQTPNHKPQITNPKPQITNHKYAI